ncbi:hypothetical protein CROQUDRAFT_100650 [Cronartium quercuum f. sp. fusiforme G11]|uniref:Uncharacterized protein n=1 Tax=Cronartium quercuum f. sp. fusiforme G11 TaxID=708437 RepID=A0A9P6T656_9BASI|nr:hypothetical protein CROQUDRAFT_100650 [Cronartium quercuum f. sp. fusiforme G11]
MKQLDAGKWHAACDKELCQMWDMNVWEVVNLPKGAHLTDTNDVHSAMDFNHDSGEDGLATVRF